MEEVITAAIDDAVEFAVNSPFPDESEPPAQLKYDPSLDPVLELSLASHGEGASAEADLRRVRRIAELQVKRALEPIKGVAAVRVRGGLEEEVHVRLDDQLLRRTGLSVQNVIDRLRQENRELRNRNK